MENGKWNEDDNKNMAWEVFVVILFCWDGRPSVRGGRLGGSTNRVYIVCCFFLLYTFSPSECDLPIAFSLFIFMCMMAKNTIFFVVLSSLFVLMAFSRKVWIFFAVFMCIYWIIPLSENTFAMRKFHLWRKRRKNTEKYRFYTIIQLSFLVNCAILYDFDSGCVWWNFDLKTERKRVRENF